MRKRVLLGAVAVGLAALGTVVAQQPLPGGYYPSRISPPPGTTLPGSNVRPGGDWSPAPPPGYGSRPTGSGVQPAGAFVPVPPAAAGQMGGRPRLSGPAVAGPEGVHTAGGFPLPPSVHDIPVPPAGVAGQGGRPLPPPNLQIDSPPLSKFNPPSVPPLPPPANITVPPPPADPSTPLATPPAPTTPAPAATKPAPSPFPPVSPSGPAVAPAPKIDTQPAPGAIPIPPPSPTPAPAAKTPAPAAAAPVAKTPTPPAPMVGLLPGRVAPSVVIEATGPETVAFGQEYSYKLIIRNTGQVSVANVRVEDEIPTGARFVGSDPPAEQFGDKLVWVLGGLEATSEKTIAVRVKPADEGEVRSRATVSFAAAVDAKTRVTRPRLGVTVTGSELARAGEETTFVIKVTNSGSGPAAQWVLRAAMSEGLVHPNGQQIEAVMGALAPGETKTLPLKVTAARAGLQACQISIIAADNPDAAAKASVNVVEPMLVVKQSGPARCLVRAEPTYTIELANPGTAATDPVQVHTVLPDGFEYSSADNGGMLNGRTVSWRLPSLASGSSRSVTLKLRAVAATNGEVLLRTQAVTAPVVPVVPAAGPGTVRPATRGLEARSETKITAEGVAAVRFEVIGLDNPVEVGKEATYEIRVINQGTGPCSNVQLAALLADGTQFVTATVGQTPAPIKQAAQQLVFDPITSLGPKSDVVYRVRVKGMQAGDMRFRVQLSCDEAQNPVVKEESTRFYKNEAP